jgi:ABC-type antimicrobial peptide transport system permease subunit
MLALPGVGCGLLAAWSGSRLLQSQLYGVSGSDLLAYTLSGVLLLVAALAACAVPARRASNVDPVEALRADC